LTLALLSGPGYADSFAADMQHWYHATPAVLKAAGVSCRYLAAMAANLPPDGATAARLSGGNHQWDQQTHMLAYIADLLAAGNWQRSGGQGPTPPPTPRPPVTQPEPGGFDTTEDFNKWRQARLNPLTKGEPDA